MRERVYRAWKDGTRVPMEYSEICNALGFTPELHYVSITTAGTISFTAGKLYEARLLASAVQANGFKMSKKLAELAG